MVVEVGEGNPRLGSVPLAVTAFGSLYADPPLSSILRQLLRHSRRLVGAMAGSKFIAGGTNLVDLMKMYVEKPPAQPIGQGER